MNDLVKRLRTRYPRTDISPEPYEAADKIERLLSRLDTEQKLLEEAELSAQEWFGKHERLESRLDKIRGIAERGQSSQLTHIHEALRLIQAAAVEGLCPHCGRHTEAGGFHTCPDGTTGAAVETQTPASSGDATKALYHELLYQVESKYPGESRHETAKRIIHEHETRTSECVQRESEPG